LARAQEKKWEKKSKDQSSNKKTTLKSTKRNNWEPEKEKSNNLRLKSHHHG
jgi:hypothetical protein